MLVLIAIIYKNKLMTIKNFTSLVFDSFLIKDLKGLNFNKYIKQRNMTNWYKKLQLIGSFILLFPLLYSCGENNVETTTKEQKQYCLDKKFEIELQHPVRQKMINEIPLLGIVEPNPDNVIHFSNLVDGIIVGTSFSLGDYVKKGQVLAKVKSTDLTEWKSQQSILASKLAVAKHELESVESMYEDGIASIKQLKTAASEVATLASELEQVSTNLQLYN